MELKTGVFYLLQDISTEKPSALSFYGTQLFRPFEKAALKNGFNVVAVRQVSEPVSARWPMMEFVVAADVAPERVTKALEETSKRLKRQLAIRSA